MNNQSQIIENLLKPLVVSGIYKDETIALKDIILEYIIRKEKFYNNKIDRMKTKYKTNFEEFTAKLKNIASIKEEEDWMEWKGAIEMKKAWQNSSKAIMKNVL